MEAVFGHTALLQPTLKPPGPVVPSCVLYVAKFSPRAQSFNDICESTLGRDPTHVPSVPIEQCKLHTSSLTLPAAILFTILQLNHQYIVCGSGGNQKRRNTQAIHVIVISRS